MSDEDIQHIIRIVADEAWKIAFAGSSPPAVCLAIEDLSDDPIRRAGLVATIKRELSHEISPHLP